MISQNEYCEAIRLSGMTAFQYSLGKVRTLQAENKWLREALEETGTGTSENVTDGGNGETSGNRVYG